MKLAITGLSNAGKTTVFNALTGQDLETTAYATVGGEPHLGVVRVPDTRVDTLAGIFRPKKTTYALVEYADFAGLTRGDVIQNRRVFDLIKDADAVVQVVRAFEDDTVPHPLDGVDPVRDIETLELEIVFGDLDLVEKRLDRMEEASRKGKKQNESERQILLKCKEALEREIPLRCEAFSDEEMKTIRHLQFASIKPEVIVLNVGEHVLNTDGTRNLVVKVQQLLQKKGSGEVTRVVALCGSIEHEIAQLPAAEAKDFLDDLGIESPALHLLIAVSYDLLGLISFLTVGEDEVRAWTIRNGTTAHAAAGKVHSDIERGFIRAEVVHYDDFISAGSMTVARERGLVRLEGKTYAVRDGDIINFRFNV